MLNRTIRNIVFIISIVESVYSGYKWLDDVEFEIGVFSIGPAEWLALSLLGLLVAVFAGVHLIKKPITWIRCKMPSYKFKSLVGDIKNHRNITQRSFILRSELLTARISLCSELDDLKIESPEINCDDSWIVFLMNLQPLAERGEVVEARKLLKIIEGSIDILK